MVARQPARALNTPWVASPARPVLVLANCTISVGALDAGLIELIDLTQGLNLCLLYADTSGLGGALVGLVPPGHQVTLQTTDVVGSPTYILQYLTEVVL